MKISSNTIGIFVVVLSLLMITILASTTYLSFSTTVFAVQSEDGSEQKFIAKLSGEQEVPPVQTNASGVALFKLKQDNVWFELNVTNLQGTTMAHIHSGKQGENGPPIVSLYKSDSPTILLNGKLAAGNISANMLEGPMANKQITDLTTAMQNDETYVNVHTIQNPTGEIRGQIII